MLDPGTLVYALVAVIAVVILTVIVRAVRLTTSSLTTASRHVNITDPETAGSLAEQIRGRDVPCPRCGGDTFALLGTDSRHKCESCAFEFEGPAHIPGSPLRPGLH